MRLVLTTELKRELAERQTKENGIELVKTLLALNREVMESAMADMESEHAQ